MKKNESKKKTEKKEVLNSLVLEEKVKDLETQVLELTKKYEDSEDSKKRALADLQNYQRRESENKKNWTSVAVAEFLKMFFPNLLELSLGAKHTKNQDFKRVVDKFFENLEKQGVTRIIPQKGDLVNPDIHDVVMAEEGESGKVVQVFEPGWQLGDRVIVPAKVSAN